MRNHSAQPFSLLMSVLWLSACIPWNKPAHKVADDSRIGVTTAIAPEHLHLQVLVGPRCRAADNPCPPGKPISQLTVAVRTPAGDQTLGTTWHDGGLDVSFSQLNALFPNQDVSADRTAPLLVEGRVVSELPIDEIFRSIVAFAIEECDAALADADLQPDYAQALLGRMLDLQLLGLTDDQLAERTTRLSDRIREKPASMWTTPRQLHGRGQDLIAGLHATGDEHAVPDNIQRQISQGNTDDASFRWALKYLPTVCKITVKGGEIVGQVMLTGPPGIALAIFDATVGEVYSKWMIQSCCQRVSAIFGAEKPPECG